MYYAYIPDPAHLSLCNQKVVAYIAGFVIFKLQKLLKCETCIESTEHTLLCLIKLKTKGGLIFSSRHVIDVLVLQQS